jgi:release factor glutamine methyltransferase
MSEPGTEVRRRTVDLLKKATDLLEERGVISPRLNAETLLAEATGMTRVELYTNFDKPVSPAETDRFRALIKRRLAHEPLQYITGSRGFRHLSLRVSPAVLIPRPETELLVERALQKMEEDPRLTVVLDLGTGSGCIALSVAQENPRAEVYASDISGDALELAGHNAEENGLEDRVCFHAGDLFGPLPDRLRGGVHLVLSNPPYVPEREFAELPPEVREHEPRLALLAEGDGTGFHLRILEEARAWLAPGGWVIMEAGSPQAAPVRERALEAGYEAVEVVFDYNGLPRFVEARLARGA